MKRDLFSTACWHLKVYTAAVIVMVLLQRLNHEVIDWKPDWPAPVGIATEHAGVLGRQHDVLFGGTLLDFRLMCQFDEL